MHQVRRWDALDDHRADMDREEAFGDVCTATVPAGEVLVEERSPPTFVHVPTAAGLRVRPAGGYPPSLLHPWVAVGTTGAVRRAGRNAEIVAVEDVDVLMIPSASYVRSWWRPLTPAQLRSHLRAGVTAP